MSETRINVDPQINVDIPDYIFFHVPSPIKAGAVGVCVSRHLNITINDSLSLNVRGCKDQWFNVDFLGFKSKHTFAETYRHPWNNHNVFLEAFDVNRQKLNRHGDKALIFGDINIDLNSDKTLVHLTDYSHILQSNAFISLIDKPTRVTRTSQTVIDHILTNDCESILPPGVLVGKDYYPISLTIILYFVPFLSLISKVQKMKNRILSVTLPPLIETNSATT